MSDLYVVGIGASAGGLEALLTLLARLHPTARVTYVIAQHMAHDGHSRLMASLLDRNSTLPVIEATTDQRLLPDRVYLIPSGSDGIVEHGFLRLRPPRAENLSTPSVNVLLSSIAEDAGRRAAGVVLSGTGSDGTQGCRTIRAKGGVTIAQDPAAACYDGMPAAAIQAGVIGHVCREADIPEKLLSLLPGVSVLERTPPAAMPRPAPRAAPPQHQTTPELVRLVVRVHEATGIDFSGYKEETLLRRLGRRMSTLGIPSMAAYLRHIDRHPGELVTLQRLFLVSLSSFFRDRESFRALESRLRQSLRQKPPGEAVRFWVPGCAMGEEVFTLAIIVAEILGEDLGGREIAVIGTDLNPDALEIAAEAIYRDTAFKEMDEHLLERHFEARGLHHQVKASIRSMCRFVRGDVVKDPAPADLDLVSCRNLLIYMGGDLQDLLAHKFHRALLPQGLLFLGPSETLRLAGNTLFRAIDHDHRLYQKR